MNGETQDFLFQIKLCGGNEVSINTLCEILQNLSLVADKTKPDEASRVQYNVKATSQGSFVIDIHTIAFVASQIVIGGEPIINLAKASVEMIIELIKLKVFLKGKKPLNIEEQDGRTIITNNEKVTQAFNIYGGNVTISNSSVDKGIIGIGKALEKGHFPEVQVLNNEDGNKNKMLKLTPEDYLYIQHSMVDENDNGLSESTIDVEFTIRKADFQGNSQWEICLDNRTKRVTIEDEEWLRKVQTGVIPIVAQRVLRAKLKTVWHNDKYGIPDTDTYKYFILKVYNDTLQKQYEQVTL